MKNIAYLLAVCIIGLSAVLLSNGCAASEKVTAKSGAQLWGENCLRCHNAPDPSDYSDEAWDAVGAHMQQRTNNITDEDIAKIVDFLKSAN